jgi:hypothetical protein
MARIMKSTNYRNSQPPPQKPYHTVEQAVRDPSPIGSKSPREGHMSPQPQVRPLKVESYTYRHKQKVIQVENIKFLNKLMSQRSQFEPQVMKERREHEEKMLKHLCRFP